MPHGYNKCLEDLTCLPWEAIEAVCPDDVDDFPQRYDQPPINFDLSEDFQENVADFTWNGYHFWRSSSVLFKGEHYFFGGESTFLDLENKETIGGETYTRWNSHVYKLQGKSLVRQGVTLPNSGIGFSRGTAAVYYGQVWLSV